MAIIIVAFFELIVVLIVLHIFAGKKILVPRLSSALIRLIVGGVSAISGYAIMNSCMQEYGRMCHEELIAGSFFASTILAIALIPVGSIQTLWLLLRRSSDKKQETRHGTG